MFSGEYNTFPFIPENKSFFFENYFRERKDIVLIRMEEKANARKKEGDWDTEEFMAPNFFEKDPR
jgi:hypothetical protein